MTQQILNLNEAGSIPVPPTKEKTLPSVRKESNQESSSITPSGFV